MPPKKIKNVESFFDLIEKSRNKNAKYSVNATVHRTGNEITLKYHKEGNKIKKLEQLVAETIFNQLHQKKKK